MLQALADAYGLAPTCFQEVAPQEGILLASAALLAPGDAVSIPSGAYHAPLATSADSVSINSFLAPAPWRGSFPSFWRGQFWTKAGLYRYLGAYLGWVWRWFGVCAVTAGAYDYL